MLRKVLRVVGVIIGWGVVLAYILYASHLAQGHRAEQRITGVVIDMVDSTELSHFTSSAHVRRQLQRKGFKMENEALETFDAVQLSSYLSTNAFVRDVDVYATYSGSVHIDIKQHEAAFRLMSGGYNSYVTADGHIFRSPQGAACYVPVVTGSYMAPFGVGFEGDMARKESEAMEQEEMRLVAIVKEQVALGEKRKRCREEIGELREELNRKWREKEASYNHRIVGVQRDIAACHKRLDAIEHEEQRLKQQRKRLELRKKKLNERYDDFANLITFVSETSKESFWGAEIVQYVADTTSVGEITLRLVPRSGSFVIEFGRIEACDAKLSKLEKFYEDGLAQLGWDRYKVIDLRYDKQVICTE